MDQLQDVVAVNGDIVSYSQLLADDHDSTKAIVENLQQLVSDQVAEKNGTLVNFVGDNFMAVFDSAAEALQASIQIASQIEPG